jgi:hypothetical protein
MKISTPWRLALAGAALAAFEARSPAAPPEEAPRAAEAATREAPWPVARARGLAWLSSHRNADDSYGRTYTVATTGLACLAFLSASDDPFAGEAGKPLVEALEWLARTQKDGLFPQQGHTWIHGQGFATLALAEAYGRILLGKPAPDLDPSGLATVVQRAVGKIVETQSTSGGWWYVPGAPHEHEGSTTVCAVQALVAAANFGFVVDPATLERGFEYLKRCQNPDGGFDYKEGPGTESMKEGTAAGVATLALMKKFDYEVTTRGVDFLLKLGADAMGRERFPYYGHLYATMGMTLFAEEMGAAPKVAPYVEPARRDVLSWQAKNGSWPVKGWLVSNGGGEEAAYSTAFACLVLSVPERRLSVFSRTPPKLPARERLATESGGAVR